MAEQLPNGPTAASADIEMKEEALAETFMNGIAAAPQPEPSLDPAMQSQPQPPSLAQTASGAEPPLPLPEHLSTIQPQQPAFSASTPPAASARPTSIPPPPSVKPEKPVPHGGPTRQYLNQNIIPHLLEGMKYLAVYEPEKPLLWLADFLRDRSKEVEGQ